MQPAGIAVAGNVGNAFDRFHAFADDRRPFLQEIEVGARQRVLIVGIALSPAGAYVLRREHEQPNSRHLIEIFAQAIDDKRRGQSAPLGGRFEADEHHAAIGARAAGAAASAKDRPDPRHGRIGHHDVGELLLKPEHRLKRDIGGRPRRTDHKAAVVDREISLRCFDIERHRQRDGRKEHDQRQKRETQHHAQRARIK